MAHYVGLDASKHTTSICVLDEQGVTTREGVVATEPTAIIAFLRGQGRRYRRVGLESMSIAPWLYEGLSRAGLPVTCIEARHAHGVLKARLNKTDRNDARGIAELMRIGAYKAVHVKTFASQQAKLLLTARRHLMRKRLDLDNLIRGGLLQFGIKVVRGKPFTFDRRVDESTPMEGDARRVVNALLTVRRAIELQIRSLTDRIDALVQEDEVCQRFMTVPGVGPIAALSYRVAVDLPQRFHRSRDVAVHLGLTPRRFRSGTVDYSGRISHHGDMAARTSLYLAAQSLLRPRTRDCGLKTWGLTVAARRGHGRAVIAVARRISVILHRIWVDGSVFRDNAQAP